MPTSRPTSAAPNDAVVAVTPLPGTIGCRIEGLDLGEPLPDAARAAVLDAFHARSLVVFPDQQLDEAAFARFTRVFGEPVVHHVGEYLDPDHPAIMRLSNNEVDGRPLGAPNNGINWHSDQIYRPRPKLAALLYGKVTP